MAVPQRAGPRLYKDILTPSLHRRFTRAAGVTLLICYVEAICIGDKSSFLWSWFPFGPAGIRALLLFISALVIYVLRVAQLHVGARTTTCSFDTFRTYAVCYGSLQTLLQYLFSAWWFSEVYVWSSTSDADLAWVTEGKSYERPRLNERPIYLRSIFFLLAVMQTCIHILFDYSHVKLPIPKAASATPRPAPSSTPLDTVRIMVPRRARASALRCMSLIILGPVIYSLLLRKTAWGWALSLAKIFWSFPRSSSAPPSIPPYHISLIYRSVTSGFLLVFLWETTNVTFSAYLAQEPLKHNVPLTDESRDPNGSLLTGLNAQKDVPKSFAFWELVYVTYRCPVRRKAIFEEIERKGGSTWEQILFACTTAIREVKTRIEEAQNPSLAPPVAQTTARPPAEPPRLPRLASPLNTSPITTVPPQSSSVVSNYAKSRGSKSQPAHSVMTPSPLRNLLTFAPDASATTSALGSRASSALQSYASLSPAITSAIRSPFHKTTRRLAAAVLLGPGPPPAPTIDSAVSTAAQPSSNPVPTPSNLSILVDATDAITTLAVASIADDPFGKAQGDVAPLIRLVMNTFDTIHGWKTNFVRLRQIQTSARTNAERVSAHVDDDVDCREVDILLTALRVGLGRLMDAFEPYADVLGLKLGEVRRAREIVAVAAMEEDPAATFGLGGSGERPR